MEQIIKIISKDLEKLDAVIKNDLNSEVDIINKICKYIINSGGKRIRPILTILCGKIIKPQNTNLLYKMAAMIEYIHTATLLHDDVVDNSSMRRGKKTANSVFGNATSVLVGDFIYSRSFQLMLESKSLEVLKLMANCTNKIAEGEILQLLNIGNSKITTEDYFKVINSKTAILFASSAEVAGIISNASRELNKNLTKFALNMGIAFQIIDDILDYVGDNKELGKNIGDDLKEGKITLPIIILLNSNNIEIKNYITDIIDNKHYDKIDEVLLLLKKENAINSAIEIAKYYSKKAKNYLTNVPDSKYKEALISLNNLAIKRIS